MRRTLFLTTFLSLPGLASATDFPVSAPVTEAEIYLQGATLLRAGTIDLPAGTHRLLMPAAPGERLPAVTVTGATLGTVEALTDAVADGRDYLSDTQRTALDGYDAAVDAAEAAEDDRIRAAADVEAAEEQLAFLRTIDATGLERLDPETLEATVDLVGARVARAEIARADARAALRAAERAVREAEFARAQAERDFDATGADIGTLSLLAVTVTRETPGPVGFEVGNFVSQMGWSPAYDVDLGADDTVTLDRKAEIWNRAGLALRGVEVTLSSADPYAQTAPVPVLPDLARIFDQPPPAPPMPLDQRMAPEGSTMESFSDPAEAKIVARADVEGPVVTYDYPAPVDLPADGTVTLALDTQTLGARVFNRASPRTDATAFRMAEVTNSTEEALLPGGATIYREGARIGDGVLPLLPAGDTVELAFGPQRHLRLEFAALGSQTGDRGLFVTSGRRVQDLVFRVRNLSDEPETVETRYALPYSEVEELKVNVSADPAPDATDVEDRQGVAEWILEVAPGAEVEVDIGVELRWPEGRTLVWQP